MTTFSWISPFVPHVLNPKSTTSLTQGICRSRTVKWDRDKIRQAEEETWRAFFADWPHVPWSTDVTTHMAIVERHLHGQLQKFFPLDSTKKKNSCLDAGTLEMMKQRAQLKKLLCNAKVQCQRHQLHVALVCWHRHQAYATGLAELTCVLRTTWKRLRFKELGLRTRAQIASARAMP